MLEEPITPPGFDLERGEIRRIIRTCALNRFLPLGSFAGFTCLRQLAVLALLHTCGTRLFAWLIPYEGTLTRLYARLRRKSG